MIKYIACLLIILTGFYALFAFAKPAEAISFSGLMHFGGFAFNQIFCANGILLFVGPPRGGTFMYSPGAQLRARFAPFAGHWVLGLASPGGACVCPSGNCLAGAIPAQGTIVIVGTN